MLTFNFTDQAAVVTGGTRGIGAGISKAFLEAGASVIATYSSNEKAAEEFAQACKEHQDRLWLKKFDVGDYKAAEEFYAWLDANFPSLEILVNNAGIRRDNIVGMMPPEDWQRVLETNLTGVYNMSKFAVHKMMQNRYGRIIILTSPSGRMGFQGQANYAASKAGVVAFAKSLSKEVAKRKITVNCVSPGFIGTDLIADLPDEQQKEYKNLVPLKRFGTIEEVADSILFLASNAATYITGATLEVTGGL